MSSKNSPGDFSLFSLFTAGLACLIPFASAYTKPVGDAPKGNPISEPGLHSIVPVGQPFTVTWQPTTQGTVTLVLLKGPSTNAIPQYAIVEKIPNTGHYIWTPAKNLAPGTTGYGIQLIDDENGQYQYTTQFGISNPDYHKHSSSSSSSSKGWGHSATHSGDHSSTWSHHGHSASAMAATANSTMTMTSTASVGTISAGHHNGTMAHPTGAMTVPTSLKTTVTAPISAAASSAVVSASSSASTSVASAVPANGATNMAASLVGLVVAAGVAVMAV